MRKLLVAKKSAHANTEADGAWTNAADQVMFNGKVSISTMYGGYGKRIFDESLYPMKEIIAQDKANGNEALKIKFFQATSAYLVKMSSGRLWLAYQGDASTAKSTDGQRMSIFVTDEVSTVGYATTYDMR